MSLKKLEKLSQAANTYKAILNAMEEWVVIVDHQAKIFFINRPYARFLGVKAEDVKGKKVTDVIENTRMHITVQTGQAERLSFQKILGSNMIASRFPIVDQGEVIGAVGTVIFHDTHEWKQINSHIKALLAEQDFQYQKSIASDKVNTGANFHLNDIIGDSQVMKSLSAKVTQVASGDVTVLIRGESGTGKELYAHAIHQLSDRAEFPFIKVNCAAIPENLLESELFGYEEGAFTGAKKGGKPGKFQLANGGTLFLDEIGDLPLLMQAKLLRVLQDREVESVGGIGSTPLNIRLITATHRPLESLIASGDFREDLYYRINVVAIDLPPLRERREDIAKLADFFLQKLSRRTGRRAPKLTVQALTAMLAYNWPGNIRELENVMEAAFYTSHDRKIPLSLLPTQVSQTENLSPPNHAPLGITPPIGSLKDQLNVAERNIIKTALIECGDNRTKAAKQLGISKSTFYEKLDKHGIS
ncbi:sigma-54-dependent Fis family transcriptional regulator [Marinomonas primoryensis]|uniref:Sigma-54-dependent Fis family transcriptional regulator n=1 Tax=Marinomonas primoryensis TaxID=178399 RepID=A0A2Z4PNY5_9GAMM|nr:sigma 54-interacting transcriptional regulator [Marinomonas primoryensis]AWX99169.1 sigma-54-dependent Fis family transcriptional regulator [Marinomonas primoryensis]